MMRAGLAVALALMAGAALPAAAAQQAAEGGSDGGATIYVVVNDTPITAYSVSQRIAVMGLDDASWQKRLEARLKSPKINEEFRAYATKRNPKSKAEVIALQKQFVDVLRRQAMAETRPQMKERALAQLINDRLKLQEAKRLGVLMSDEELDQAFTEIAKKNDKSPKEFEALLVSQGIAARSFKERLRAQVSWTRVVSRRFRGDVAVGQGEIDQELVTASAGTAGGAAGAAAGLRLQRLLIPQVNPKDAAAVAASYVAAEQLRRQAKPCQNLDDLARKVKGAQFEDLGTIPLNQLEGELRPILTSARPGDVPPPVLSGRNIELYGVCEATAPGAGPDPARSAARQKIERAKLEALSKGLLSDLCAAASIEARNGIQLTKACGTE